MGDDERTGNVFDAMRNVRARTEAEKARREQQPVVADAGEAADGTASLEETVGGTDARQEETADKVKEGLKDFGRALSRGYKRTSEAVRDAHLGEKVKATAGKVAGGIGTVGGSVKSGTKAGVGKIRDARDKIRGIANPEKQLTTLEGLADLVMLYEPSAGSNPALRRAEGVTSSVLVVGNSLEENKQLVNDLVAYVEGRAGELEYPIVNINQFEDFEKYTAEHLGQGRECKIVRLNSSYFVKASNMRSNSNLLNLFRAAADPKGIALILAEDIDLLYSQAGDRTEVLNSNARVTGLKRVVEQHGLKGVYKGNWLLVCTTADEDGLPDEIEKIVKTKL